nr:MAG: succinyl-CoA synthetase, alpha subunit [Candidatus Nanosalinarum sp. J07AB56]
MSILVDEDTKVVIQGITGREASEKLPAMQEYGTEVVAGVTPGKEGQEVEGVPVYDTVSSAAADHDFDTSLLYVPPFAAKDAAFEAMEHVDLLNIITERVPTRDTYRMLQRAEETDTRIVGPTSVGIISPGKCKLGPIGGIDAEDVYGSGRVGVASKSGGMTTETAWQVNQAGYGVSTAAGLGGDVLQGTSFADMLQLFEEDEQTEAAVVFGELGGTYEEKAADVVEDIDLPVVAFVAGEFAEELPSTNYGHAGAVIRGDRGKPSEKKRRLRNAGARVVDQHHLVGHALKEILD